MVRKRGRLAAAWNHTGGEHWMYVIEPHTQNPHGFHTNVIFSLFLSLSPLSFTSNNTFYMHSSAHSECIQHWSVLILTHAHTHEQAHASNIHRDICLYYSYVHIHLVRNKSSVLSRGPNTKWELGWIVGLHANVLKNSNNSN